MVRVVAIWQKMALEQTSQREKGLCRFPIFTNWRDD
jgi:hypothetical protein